LSRNLSIVIPAYNEEQRLPRTVQHLYNLIQEKSLQWTIQEVLVIDDGSRDGTAAWVEAYQKHWPLLKVIRQPVNRGKGAAVHTGMRASEADWILVADADMATPWLEMNKFSGICSDYDLIMGSRALGQSEILVRQHWLRQNMGKTFNRIMKGIVGLPFRDTQCGFKLVRNDSLFKEKILPKLKVERFAWDVELLLYLRASARRLLEFPVQWSHQEASHVRIVRDSLEMLWTVLKLRIRIKKDR